MSNKRYSYYEALEHYEYTENVRNRLKDYALFSESGNMIKSIITPYEQYDVGSNVEATQLLGIQSDTDTIELFTAAVGFEKQNPCSYDKYQPDRYVFLDMVSDPWTRPGLTKLVVPPGIDFAFCTRRDLSGRKVVWWNKRKLISRYLQEPLDFVEHDTGFQISGPAMSYFSIGTSGLDIVHGFRCGKWPLCAQPWLRRWTTALWLGKDEMQRLANMPCILVPTGHHESSLEWRISFSLQERELIWRLSDVQYKCFVLMKYVKVTCFTKEEIDNGNSLTSYHCKTALLYAVENNLGISNLTECTTICFRLLLKWAIAKHCPSYFVPTVNLFSKFEATTLEKIQRVLEDVLSDTVLHFNKGLEHMVDLFRSIYDVKCGGAFIANMETIGDTIAAIGFRFLKSLNQTHSEISYILGHIFSCILGSSLSVAIDFLARFLSVKLEGTNMIKRLIFPLLHTSLACHIIVKAMSTKDRWTRDFLFLVSAFHFQKGLKSDRMSSKLKLATVLIHTGHKESAIAQLEELSMVDTRKLFFGCSCNVSFPGYDDSRTLKFVQTDSDYREHLKSLPTDEIIQRHMCHCVMFLPTEIEITPYPLQFEMFRSVGVPHDARVKRSSVPSLWWYRCAVIPPESYRRFLLHLTGVSSIKIGRVTQDMLETTTENTLTSHHMETEMNVFGWLVERSGQYLQALDLYLSSWQHLKNLPSNYPVYPYRKDSLYLRNAAKWHIVLLLYRIWCNR